MKFLLLIAGIAIVVLGVVAQVAWLGLCFGTVIVGVIMLIFNPSLLILPIPFIVLPGALMVAGAWEAINDKSE